MTLRRAAAEPSTGMSIPHLDAFLDFLRARLSAADLAEGESLLHAAISPHHARRRHDEAAAAAFATPINLSPSNGEI